MGKKGRDTWEAYGAIFIAHIIGNMHGSRFHDTAAERTDFPPIQGLIREKFW